MIAGKSMIQRVYEQALKCTLLSAVWVATDDQVIFKHVAGFGGQVMLTSIHHRSGTERCQEVVSKLHSTNQSFDAIINIQGDEPFIDPAQIGQVAGSFCTGYPDIVTLIKKINRIEVLSDPNVVKVVTGMNGTALYFSRSSIPFVRGKVPQDWLQTNSFYEHVGIYGYTSSVLDKIVGLPPSPLEIAESLEQLRWLEHGLFIHTRLTEYESVAIDTPADLLKITNRTGEVAP